MGGSVPFVLANVHIIESDVASLKGRVNILIEAGKISKISEQSFPPEQYQILDMAGRYVMPGLIDCHTHAFLADTNIGKLNEIPVTLMTARASNILKDMLMRGFTTIRDAAGGDWGIKQALADGEILGPRMFISGRALSQTGGHGDFKRRTENEFSGCMCSDALSMMARTADGVDELRKAVRDEFRKGADQIKIMVSGGVASPHDPLERDQYAFEEIQCVVEEAQRRGSYVMAHAYGASAIKTALRAGVRCIEHGNLIDREAADLAAEKGAFIVPTLVTYAVLEQTAHTSGWSMSMLDKLKRVREQGMQSIEICKAAGAQLGFGTDLLGDGFTHQSREFSLRSHVQSARDVIKSATQINARILQCTGELGEISEGAIADILVLEADPSQDISVLENPKTMMPFIMKEGHIIKNTLSNIRGVL